MKGRGEERSERQESLVLEMAMLSMLVTPVPWNTVKYGGYVVIVTITCSSVQCVINLIPTVGYVVVENENMSIEGRGGGSGADRERQGGKDLEMAILLMLVPPVS